MSALRVSCIVPVYNGERFLAEALDSILAQTHRPFEIIVIDDGSTDGTPEVIAGYAGRVRYQRQENAGVAAARNAGLELASGELIAILDADDLWHPEKLARQSARFEARPELGISLTHVHNFWVPELAYEKEQSRGLLDTAMSHGSLVARRTLFDRIGPFDAGARHKDVIGWLIRACQQGAAAETLAEVLAYRRIHQSNLSRRRGGEDADELLALAQMLVDSRRKPGSVRN
jgi:glycosyltransferase involved in cell wall biosynthesis